MNSERGKEDNVRESAFYKVPSTPVPTVRTKSPEVV